MTQQSNKSKSLYRLGPDDPAPYARVDGKNEPETEVVGRSRKLRARLNVWREQGLSDDAAATMVLAEVQLEAKERGR